LVTRTGNDTINVAETLIFQNLLLASREKVVPNFFTFLTFLSETDVSVQQKQDQNKIKISTLPKWCIIHSIKIVSLKKVTPILVSTFS